MRTFTSDELQHHASDVQQCALREPAFISAEGKTQLVIMSLDEFNRLRGRKHQLLDAVRISDDVMEELQRIADESPADASEPRLLGGLLEGA